MRWQTDEAEVTSEILQVNPKKLVFQQARQQMNGSLVKKLEADMRKRGYDLNRPVSAVRLKDGRIVISDGHHRALAAARAGLETIPVQVDDSEGNRYD